MQTLEAANTIERITPERIDSNLQSRSGQNDVYLSQVTAFRTIRDALASDDCAFAPANQRHAASQAARLIARLVGDVPLRGITIFGDEEDHLLEIVADCSVHGKRLIVQIDLEAKYKLLFVGGGKVHESAWWHKFYDAPNIVRWLTSA